MTQAQRDIKRRFAALEHARESGNVSKTCRFFGISRQAFYEWKRAFESGGEAALVNRKPGCAPGTSPLRTPPEVEEKILHLRRRYHFGPQRIAWYLARYLDIKITARGVYMVLCRNGMNRLPRNQRERSIPTYRRYEKQVPGHHVQVDVKFLIFRDSSGQKVKRYQFTAIDDATRVRALKIYLRHTQAVPSTSSTSYVRGFHSASTRSARIEGMNFRHDSTGMSRTGVSATFISKREHQLERQGRTISRDG